MLNSAIYNLGAQQEYKKTYSFQSRPQNKGSVIYLDRNSETANSLSSFLEQHGYKVLRPQNLEECFLFVQRNGADIILIDIPTAGINSVDLCTELRRCTQIPLVLLSSQDNAIEKINALETGADDYLIKPASPRELLARVRSSLRRSSIQALARHGDTQALGELTINSRARTVTLRGQSLHLTAYEFNILRTLTEAPGSVVPRERLRKAINCTNDSAFDRSVDLHISHIRKKLGDDPKRPRWIKTIRGVGYLLAPDLK